MMQGRGGLWRLFIQWHRNCPSWRCWAAAWQGCASFTTRAMIVPRGDTMALDQHLGDAAAEFARRHAATYGKDFRDGADDLHPHEPEHASPALPTAIHLIYEGDSGEQTERVVTLLTAWRTGEIVYFKGRCHLRRAIRTFR